MRVNVLSSVRLSRGEIQEDGERVFAFLRGKLTKLNIRSLARVLLTRGVDRNGVSAEGEAC